MIAGLDDARARRALDRRRVQSEPVWVGGWRVPESVRRRQRQRQGAALAGVTALLAIGAFYLLALLVRG